MPIHIIPVDKLSAEALDGVIQELIFRNGTDYGEFEVSAEKKFRQVKQKLENGLAVLLYDDEMETTNIFRHDDPILKKLEWAIPLFSRVPFRVKEGPGEILRNWTDWKIPLNPPLQKGEEETVQIVQFLPSRTRCTAPGKMLAMTNEAYDKAAKGTR